MMMQPNTPSGVRRALAQYGAAAGPSQLLQKERDAAIEACESGIYTLFRSSSSLHPDFCTRIAPTAACFCGHDLRAHSVQGMRPCGNCPCKGYSYVPYRPEEVGESWLVRRKGFNVGAWRAKCKCKCGSDAHDPVPPRRCRSCECSAFKSDFLCVVCDLHWEDHTTVTEGVSERRAAGLPIGAAFMPLSASPEMQGAVFSGSGGVVAERGKTRGVLTRPFQTEPEKSVRLMPVNCSGRGGESLIESCFAAGAGARAERRMPAGGAKLPGSGGWADVRKAEDDPQAIASQRDLTARAMGVLSGPVTGSTGTAGAVAGSRVEGRGAANRIEPTSRGSVAIGSKGNAMRRIRGASSANFVAKGT